MNDGQARLVAGAAVVDITPAVGLPMGGYGARTGVATGTADPLFVRTVVLSDGETDLVLAVCDLVAAWPDIVERARELITADCGIPPDHVMVTATHTHSGPANLSERTDPHLVATTAQKIAGSVRLALDRLEPVTLKVGAFHVDSVSRNRRDPDGPFESLGQVLLAATPAGATVATLVAFACHATVLEHDNLLWSADFPGAVVRLVEAALGGTAVYLQGACGDVNPVWMRHDRDDVDRVGAVVGGAAVRTAGELGPLGEGQWVVNLSWSEDLRVEPAPGTLVSPARLRAGRAFVDLPRRTIVEPEAIQVELAGLEAQLAAAGDDRAARRRLLPRINQLAMERAPHAGRWRGGPGRSERAEIQAFRLGPECTIVGLPGEFFVETGRAVRASAGIEHVLVAGYANGYLGYLPTADQFPLAGYEVGCARFEPEATDLVVRTAADLVRSLD